MLDLTKGRDADLFDRSIDNHVSRLRKKIEPDPKNPRYIKTVWGGGYIFAMEPEAAEGMKLWPRTLVVQLIAVTAAAVVVSNLAVAWWFERGNERRTKARSPSACWIAPPRWPPRLTAIPPASRER